MIIAIIATSMLSFYAGILLMCVLKCASDRKDML